MGDNKSSKVFGSAGALSFPGTNARRAYTTIRFGNVVKNFTMIDESQGTQASRLQVDATLDGSVHVVGTTTGTGSYSAVFFDGPICSEKRESAMQEYLKLKSIQDRVATIYFYAGADKFDDKGAPTSTPTAKFSGVLNNMAVSLADDNGLIFLRVALDLLGSWESSGK